VYRIVNLYDYYQIYLVLISTKDYLPVYVGGQQHEPLKQEPPFRQPVEIGHSGSRDDEIFLIKHVLIGLQPDIHVLLPSELQIK
jgi:hypothetical protein